MEAIFFPHEFFYLAIWGGPYMTPLFQDAQDPAIDSTDHVIYRTDSINTGILHSLKSGHYTSMNKPFSQSCENNKQAILSILKDVFDLPCKLVEIGSGTGQHTVFFAEHLPHITWCPTDQAEYLKGITQWVNEVNLDNIKPPVKLNVRDQPWPYQQLEAVFTANTLHIMSQEEVEIFFARLGEYLQPNAKFCSYGPYNKNGAYTSESNARFDQWLKERDPLSGIRHLEDLIALSKLNKIELTAEVAMPANNFCLIWQKVDD